MKKILKSAVLVALAAAVVGLSSCGGEKKEAAAPAGEKHYKFGFTCMDQSNPFFVTIEKTIREEVEKRGDKLVSVDPAKNVTRQIQQVEDVIAQKVDGFFLNPAEAEGIIPALDQLRAANIPIVNFDAEVADMSYITSYAGSDNYNAGKVCGEDLIKKCPNGGDIIVLDEPTANSATDRTNGFLDSIIGHGFNIVAQQNAKGSLQVAMGVAEDLLQAHPNVVAIFGSNDPVALGALAAANAAGIKGAKIYGVDGSPDIKKELTDPNSLIEGTGAQSPVSIAKKSVELMYKIMEGEKVDARYPVPTFLISRDNVNQYGTDGWQ